MKIVVTRRSEVGLGLTSIFLSAMVLVAMLHLNQDDENQAFYFIFVLLFGCAGICGFLEGIAYIPSDVLFRCRNGSCSKALEIARCSSLTIASINDEGRRLTLALSTPSGENFDLKIESGHPDFLTAHKLRPGQRVSIRFRCIGGIHLYTLPSEFLRISPA